MADAVRGPMSPPKPASKAASPRASQSSPTAPPPVPSDTSAEVLRWLADGQVSTVEAVRQLRHLGSREPAAPSREPEGGADQVLAQLDALVGLREVKRQVREICAFVDIQRRRAALQLAAEPHTLHMVFRGAPGTGKTTVARLLGELFRELGALPKGHLIEVERADLVGEYIGHTAQKTREVVRRALGGVLFIDEAYALARGGGKDFGKEAIDALVKVMEDKKSEFLLILAGYPREMAGFMEANPGLRSRFAIHIDFPEYRPEELAAIARLMLAERQYRLASDAEEHLVRTLDRRASGWHENAGNARMVRNLMERAIRRQAVRLVQHGRPLSREELMTLTAADLDEVH